VKDNQRLFHFPFACHPAYYQPPGARTEKVARLRDAVSHGVYQVDARKVAQALLKEHLIHQMIMQVMSDKVNYGRIAPEKNH
jgi:hypothetical protein